VRGAERLQDLGQRADAVDPRLGGVLAVGASRRVDRARLLVGGAALADRRLDDLLGLQALRVQPVEGPHRSPT